MKTYKFKQDCELITTLPSRVFDLIEHETMLFSADINFAYQHGGPLTQEVLQEIYKTGAVGKDTPEGYVWVVDTKVVMLMPGMYPCIGGWHCDAVPRNEYGQPNLDKLDNPSEHFIFVADTSLSPTHMLALEEFEVPADLVHPYAVWRSVNTLAEMRRTSSGHTQLLNAGLYHFGSSCLHRGSPAKQRGWRYFFRMSLMPTVHRNKIRTQVNVYTDTSGGW